MSKGRVWPPEWREFRDPASGTRVRQITDYRGHSHHLYFTNPGWYDSGRRLLLGSDRENRTDLHSLDLETGEITQLTDLEPLPLQREVQFLTTSVNPVREEAYFLYGLELRAIDLGTFEERTLWNIPEGFRRSMINSTADGKYVCAGVFEDLSGRLRLDYLHGYVGFAQTWEAHPQSRIVKVATDGSGAEVVWEERCWIGHVNTSPTQPRIITFCHEGPWLKVDNRIWGLDIEEGRPWKIRPREGGERVGHEYWFADGIHLGYHGGVPGGKAFFGRVKYDDSERAEYEFSEETGHIHSNDMSLVVGDGGGAIRIWRWNGAGYDGPRLLAEHRSSMHFQQVHAHPRFTPDGREVLFTSDRSGYGNLYLAEVQEFESLPKLDEG